MAGKCWDATSYDEQHEYVWQLGAPRLDRLAPKEAEPIFDLGCGTGPLTAAIAERGAEAVGIDNNPEMTAAAKIGFPNLVFHVMDAVDFAFGAPFDAVFSNADLHWVNPPEQAAQHASAMH